MKDAPDFGKAAGDYGRWRQGFPSRFFDELAGLGIGRQGQRVLDVGTGTGLMAREMARRGCAVTGLDPSPALLDEARRLCAEESLAIGFVQARAEATGLPDGAFDVITAAQCWHWFDRATAARECLRLLGPGGRLVIAYLDWLDRPGSVAEATAAAIDRWSQRPPDRVWTFNHPEWLSELTDAGFGDYRISGYPVRLSYSHEGWIGRITASAQIGPVLDAERLAAFRAELSALLADRFPEDPLAIEHRVFAIVLTRP